jgi:ketosteroid isomerase-like protein
MVEDNRAAVHSRLKVRFVPKDIVFTSDVLDAFRFEDGKIIELVEFADTALIKSVVIRGADCSLCAPAGRTTGRCINVAS